MTSNCWHCIKYDSSFKHRAGKLAGRLKLPVVYDGVHMFEKEQREDVNKFISYQP